MILLKETRRFMRQWGITLFTWICRNAVHPGTLRTSNMRHKTVEISKKLTLNKIAFKNISFKNLV